MLFNWAHLQLGLQCWGGEGALRCWRPHFPWAYRQCKSTHNPLTGQCQPCPGSSHTCTLGAGCAAPNSMWDFTSQAHITQGLLENGLCTKGQAASQGGSSFRGRMYEAKPWPPRLSNQGPMTRAGKGRKFCTECNQRALASGKSKAGVSKLPPAGHLRPAIHC